MLFIGGEPMALCCICWYLSGKADVIDSVADSIDNGKNPQFPYNLIDTNELLLKVYHKIGCAFQPGNFTKVLYKTELRTGSDTSINTAKFNGQDGFFVVYLPRRIRETKPFSELRNCAHSLYCA
jgi:hypothetical protein